MRRSVLIGTVLIGGSLLGVGSFALARSEPGATEATITTEVTATTVTTEPSHAASVEAPATTSTTEPVTTTTAPGREWLTIQGVGDTNFDPAYIPNLVTHGYEYAFGGLRGLFRGDDLSIVNLECAASELGSPLPKEFTFRCDPAALPIAREFGVDVANLANNHSQDYGTEAMLDSIVNVTRAGIRAVGVGADVGEATAPGLIDVGGWRIAVLGMGGIVPSASWLATDERAGMASGDDVDQMTAAVRSASEVADLVVVSIHWGWELETEPRSDDRARAAAMVDAGADVIFGHHPHRLGALEFVDGVPVFWTLGNFVWPRLSEAGATTAIGRVIVSPDGTIDACLVPVVIETSGQPVVQAEPDCSEPR